MLNTFLSNIEPYASKSISQKAKLDPTILNLSIGEPEFGPPEWATPKIQNILNSGEFTKGVKRYEDSKGDISLRKAIAEMYHRLYNIIIDPETEILITHGAAEAVTLALLTTTDPGDSIAITDPTYSLYKQSIGMLGRNINTIPRLVSEHEYYATEENNKISEAIAKSKAVIINSPENPTGYVMSNKDWEALSSICLKDNKWLLHDEVYSSFVYKRTHVPAWGIPSLSKISVMINSCSKMLGLPGLRIGWLIGPASFIKAAAAAHDYLCLGVNILSEKIAETILSDNRLDYWISQNNVMLKNRMDKALELLTPQNGFSWPREPMSGIFIFPHVSAELYQLAQSANASKIYTDAGSTVANYLIESCHVAVVPGKTYGVNGTNHIRLTTSISEKSYSEALYRLSKLIK